MIPPAMPNALAAIVVAAAVFIFEKPHSMMMDICFCMASNVNSNAMKIMNADIVNMPIVEMWNCMSGIFEGVSAFLDGAFFGISFPPMPSPKPKTNIFGTLFGRIFAVSRG